MPSLPCVWGPQRAVRQVAAHPQPTGGPPGPPVGWGCAKTGPPSSLAPALAPHAPPLVALPAAKTRRCCFMRTGFCICPRRGGKGLHMRLNASEPQHAQPTHPPSWRQTQLSWPDRSTTVAKTVVFLGLPSSSHGCSLSRERGSTSTGRGGGLFGRVCDPSHLSPSSKPMLLLLLLPCTCACPSPPRQACSRALVQQQHTRSGRSNKMRRPGALPTAYPGVLAPLLVAAWLTAAPPAATASLLAPRPLRLLLASWPGAVGQGNGRAQVDSQAQTKAHMPAAGGGRGIIRSQERATLPSLTQRFAGVCVQMQVGRAATHAHGQASWRHGCGRTSLGVTPAAVR